MGDDRSERQPQAYPEPGFYPTTLALRYDSERREYTIAFEGLLGR
jgi:hypothetical protein